MNAGYRPPKEDKNLFSLFENRIEDKENDLSYDKQKSFQNQSKPNTHLSTVTVIDEIVVNSTSVVEGYLSSESAANYLDCTKNALRLRVYKGKVKAYKFGKILLFKKSDLDALLVPYQSELSKLRFREGI